MTPVAPGIERRTAGDLVGLLLEDVQVVAVDPDPEVGADAREQLVEPQLDRLAEAVEGARDDPAAELVDLVDQLRLGAGLGPGLGLVQEDPGVGQVDARGLQPDLGPADPADDRADLVRELLAEGRLQALGVGDPFAERGARGAGLRR